MKKAAKKILEKCKNLFVDHINFCIPDKSDGTPKEDSLFYDLYCLIFWPIPQNHPCWCCAGVRGIIYGFIIGGGVVYVIV